MGCCLSSIWGFGVGFVAHGSGFGLFEFGDSGLGFLDHWGSGFAISGLVHRFGFGVQVWLRL